MEPDQQVTEGLAAVGFAGSLVPLIGMVGLLVLVAVGAFVLSRRRPRDASAATGPWAPPAAPGEAARPRSQPANGQQEKMVAPEEGQGSVATQPSTCPVCATDLTPGMRFCPTCGLGVS
jgi:hypothetical protein